MKIKLIVNSKNNSNLYLISVDASSNTMLGFSVLQSGNSTTVDNIYIGRITHVEKSLNAAFVHYGDKKDGFLPFKSIHASYFSSLDNELKAGLMIIVQVLKEPRDSKGAHLTTFISLSSRFIILKPNKERAHGISRSIVDRKRVKEMLEDIYVPGGHIIARTSMQNIQKADFLEELSKLLSVWKVIQDKMKKSKQSPLLVYGSSSTINIILNNFIRSNVKEVYVDDADLFYALKNMLKIYGLSSVKVHLHRSRNILIAHGLQRQVNNIFKREVNLSSGGSVIFDQAEALMAIDVNSKKFTDSDNLENTAFKTNQEAALEICNQILFRNISGLMVIDFIDMSLSANRQFIEELMISLLRKDKVRVQATRISKLGIMEISRQYTGTSNILARFNKCKNCKGSGRVISQKTFIEYLYHSIIKYCEDHADTKLIYLHLSPESIDDLYNQTDKIKDIEKSKNIKLILIHNVNLQDSSYYITHTAELNRDILSYERGSRPKIQTRAPNLVKSVFSKIVGSFKTFVRSMLTKNLKEKNARYRNFTVHPASNSLYNSSDNAGGKEVGKSAQSDNKLGRKEASSSKSVELEAIKKRVPVKNAPSSSKSVELEAIKKKTSLVKSKVDKPIAIVKTPIEFTKKNVVKDNNSAKVQIQPIPKIILKKRNVKSSWTIVQTKREEATEAKPDALEKVKAGGWSDLNRGSDVIFAVYHPSFHYFATSMYI